jgi:isopropylmalate/homocitrate/citramalate synthase
MAMPKSVQIVDVGPRDGLQSEPGTVPAEIKIGLIHRLADAGIPAIEAGAFVSPEWVPQMADSEAVLTAIVRRPGTVYPVLVPNMKGFERARAANVTEIALFSAASETFSQKNTNCSIAESIERAAPVAAAGLAAGMRVRGYISCALGCPYEGDIGIAKVADLAGQLLAMGCYEISLGDTIGVGTPAKAREMVQAVAGEVPMDKLGLHFHDTYGQALANILACLELGVATIDSAVAGLGGCPYAPGASGNVATEDVLYMLAGLGVETGVDFAVVVAAGQYICEAIGRAPTSKAAQAFLATAA